MAEPEDREPTPTPTPAVDPEVPPEDAQRVVAEIRAVAESRADEDSDEQELSDLAASGRARRSSAAITIEPPQEPDELTPQDLLDAWPLLDHVERVDGLRVLPGEDAEDFFVGLSAAEQASLIAHLRPRERRHWIRLLEPDDAADVLQATEPPEDRAALLAMLDAPTRKEVTALLAYAEDEAGGLMSTRYARLRPNMTAGEAIGYLQRQARATVETIYVAYVLDAEQHLLGVVSFRDLFTANATSTVADIMESEVVRVTEDMDQETVARVFAAHDLSVIPVVDKDDRMKGIVTVDDIVDVVQEEATEDAQKFGGVEVLDLPYLLSSRREMVRKRGRWLTILLIGEMLTATALGFFENELIPTLALFLPLIISSGGNSGSQASTLVIRAMALGEVRTTDWLHVFRREIIIGFALGALLGGFASVRVLLWGAAGQYGAHYGWIGLTVALSVTGCVLWGTLSGAMLPFVLRKVGADPANASAPLVATLVDVSGIIIYFTVAKLVLSGVLL